MSAVIRKTRPIYYISYIGNHVIKKKMCLNNAYYAAAQDMLWNI